MRDEWRHLSKETRESVLLMMFGPVRPAELNVRESLVELGISTELTDWIVDSQLRRMIAQERMLFERQLQGGREVSGQDRFNRLILSLIFLIICITWLVQESQSMRSGQWPIALPISILFTVVAWTLVLQCLRYWVRSLRRRDK